MGEQKTSFFKSRLFQVILLAIFSTIFISIVGFVYYLNTQNITTVQTKKVDTEIENLKVGLSTDMTGQDIGPTKNYDQTSYIFNNVYSSLVSYSEDGRLEPALSTNWSNPDNTTWKFFLRKDVKFSDGKAFTANDVKYTFDTIKGDPDSQLNYYFSEIKSVNVINPQEVEIKTTSPAPYLTSKLSFLLIVPDGSKKITFADTPGTGPFIYNKGETVVGKQLVFDRNDEYWGEKPKVKKVTVIVYPQDEKDKVEAFQKGDVQMIDVLTRDAYQQMSGFGKAKNFSVSENAVFYLVLNNSDKAKDYIGTEPNPLRDKRVRLAMWEALDTADLINKTMEGIAIPASQVVARQTFGFDPSIKRPEYSLEKARKLMEDSGNQEGFSIKLMIGEARKDVGEYIKKSWGDINIDVELDVIKEKDENIYINRFMSHEFGAGFISWSEDSRDGQNTLLTLFSDNDQNMGAFKSENLREVMTKLASETNQRERQKLIQEGMRVIRDEVPVVPLYSKKINWFVTENIEWKPAETLDIYFKNAKGIEEIQVEAEKKDPLSKLRFW